MSAPEGHGSTSPPARLPFDAGLLLLAGTGFTDVYAYLAHGHVFAEAMTGNLVLIGVGLIAPGAAPWWHPLTAFAAFVAGIAVVWTLARERSRRSRAAQLTTLGVETAVLVVVGFLPASVPEPVVVCVIAFCAGLQIAAFNRVGAAKVTTVVMTTNTLHTVDATLQALARRVRHDVEAAARLVATLLAFVAGVFGGAYATDGLGVHAAWVCAGVFALAGVLYAVRPVPRT